MSLSDQSTDPDYVDRRSCRVAVDSQRAFAPIRRIGGEAGWYYANFLWWVRGAADRLVGGVGMKRGRREPDTLKIGDVVDCWRVEDYRDGEFLRLALEMKLPGRGWLQFEVRGNGDHSQITQTALFEPKGVLGAIYWYASFPIHHVLFRGMLRAIAEAAQKTPHATKVSVPGL